MNADPAAQARLLDLQALDSALDRLAARRRFLPELAEIERLDALLAGLADEIVRAETEVGDIARQQTRLENEVDLVRARADRDRKRLDSGQVGSPRELENLQSEIASLGRRQGVLEDDLLEVMEARETVEGRVTALRTERARVAAEREAAVARRDATFEEIDAEAASRRAARDGLAPQLPSELVALYEKIRASSGGVGAAALVRRRCEGCHLELSGADLRAVAAAPPDEALRCEECRRILVRTGESGL